MTSACKFAQLLALWQVRDMCAPTVTPPPTTRGGVFVDRDEVAMPRSDKPLPDQITAAATELKLARRDGSAEWIAKSAAALDELLDQIPRTAQHSDVR